MKFFKWKKNKNTVQNPCWGFGEPCSCGCSPDYFFYLFDGKAGMTVLFANKTEFIKFRNDLGLKKIQKIFNPSYRENLK